MAISEIRPVTAGGIKLGGTEYFLPGVVMKISFKSLRRSFVLRLIGAALFVSVLTGTQIKLQQCMQPVTVTSNPCGAMIYIDGIHVGRTPMSFPMPTGRYTLVLLAPGHQHYVQRILVPDAPLKIEANLALKN